jgi:glutamate synthase domain-containing protein 3
LETTSVRIDAQGFHFRELNRQIRIAAQQGATDIILSNVNGQRYIADGLPHRVTITVLGVPGNDLGAFMNGPKLLVQCNAQDGVGNTMNDGTIVIGGDAGDVLGYGMRGGKVFVAGDVGYRSAIHMKACGDKNPVIIVGGGTGDFLAEYMAGGIVVVLGMNARAGESLTGEYVGTGMHGGAVYVRGTVERHQIGREVGVVEPTPDDHAMLHPLLAEYCQHFSVDLEPLFDRPFVKLIPLSSRPYGNLYCP